MVITINYIDVDQYISVDLHENGLKKSFNSGDFIKDWWDMRKYVIIERNNSIIMCSSTVDHFIMDGAPYDSTYLHMIDGKPILKYIHPDDYKTNKYIEISEGIEFFVPEGTKPTWEELKKKYDGD
jgi:hypothetical protein